MSLGVVHNKLAVSYPELHGWLCANSRTWDIVWQEFSEEDDISCYVKIFISFTDIAEAALFKLFWGGSPDVAWGSIFTLPSI